MKKLLYIWQLTKNTNAGGQQEDCAIIVKANPVSKRSSCNVGDSVDQSVFNIIGIVRKELKAITENKGVSRYSQLV